MEKLLYKVLFGGILCLIFLSGLLIFFLSMGFDEAWLLSHYREIAEGEVFAYKMAPNSLTSGGVFTLLNAVLFRFFGAHLWIFRMVSFCSLLGILSVLLRWAKMEKMGAAATCIVLSGLLSMSGSIELSAQAFADFLGLFFILIGLSAARSRPLFFGACLGIASSIRLNLLSIIPAVLLEIILFETPAREKFRQGTLVLLSGALFFFLGEWIVVYISPEKAAKLFEYSEEFIGWHVMWFDYVRILNRWIVANGFFPFFLMVAISLFAWFDRTPLARIFRTLALFGWIHWCAWILRAPIAHLRYLWPSLAAFGIVGGFALASLYRWAQTKEFFYVKCAVLLVACSLVLQNFVSVSRALLFGDSNLLSWEWCRETPLQSFRWYRATPNQQKMAEYLRSHYEKKEDIGAIGLNLEMEMLSGCRVIPLQFYFDKWHTDSLPKKLLVSPMLGSYIYLEPELFIWMEKNLVLEAQFGGYILYNVIGNYPRRPEMFRHFHTPYPQFPHAKPAL